MAASIKQLELIDTLVADLELEGELKTQVYAIAMKPDARPAHEVRDLITGMIERRDARRAARPAAAAPAAAASGRGMWQDVPDGRYALERDTLERHAVDHLIGGEGNVIFVRVSTWTPPGKTPVTYVRQIKGAPGDWTKIKHSPGVNRNLRDALLAVGPVNAGRLFSELYTVCARCLSPLTDQRSRETGYGPDCRAAMGIGS